MPRLRVPRPASAADGNELAFAIGQADQIIAVIRRFVDPLLHIFPVDAVARRHSPSAIADRHENAGRSRLRSGGRVAASGEREDQERNQRQRRCVDFFVYACALLLAVKIETKDWPLVLRSKPIAVKNRRHGRAAKTAKKPCVILGRLKGVGWDKQTGCWWAVGRRFAPVCDGPPSLRDLVPPYRLAPRITQGYSAGVSFNPPIGSVYDFLRRAATIEGIEGVPRKPCRDFSSPWPAVPWELN